MSISTTRESKGYHELVYFPENDMTGYREGYESNLTLELECSCIKPGDLSKYEFESLKFTNGIGYTMTYKRVNSNIYVDVFKYDCSMYITEPYGTFEKFNSLQMEKHYFIPKDRDYL